LHHCASESDARPLAGIGDPDENRRRALLLQAVGEKICPGGRPR
jgi:hypothetical protein